VLITCPTFLILTVTYNMKKRNFTGTKLILALFVLFTLSNCSLAPCLPDSNLEYVTDNPKSAFIAGKYKLESKISKYEVLENTENTELIINEDFTFQINNLPIEGWSFGVFQEKENILINILGKWKITKGENGFLNKKNSIFHVNYDLENSEENSTGYSSSWKIYQKNGKAVIFYSLGDPDNCEAVRFIKLTE
jgi:hypothetical protein